MQSLEIKKHKLSNGLFFFYCYTPDTVVFELSLNINTGVRDECSENNGVSHFLEHMMFRGSKKYPDSVTLARALESFGGETNAMTGVEHTNYWIKGDAEKTLQAIECFAEFVLNPCYVDLELERQVILQEMASDYNDDGTHIDVESLGLNALFAEHPIGLPIIGTEDSVKKISTSVLEEKRAHFYTPKRCILSLHTSASEDLVLQAIERYFVQNWPKSTQITPERQLSPNILTRSSSIKKAQYALSLQNNADNQFALKLILPTVGNLSADVVHTIFLQRILDDGICSRLPARIREKYGLVYDISCDSQFFYEIGVLSIDATVSGDYLTILLERLQEELKLLTTEPPTQQEIEHIKYRYLFDLKQVRETPSRLLNREVNAHFMTSPFTLDDEVNVVSSTTSNDIFKVVKQIFSSGRKGFVLVGPKARKKREIVEKFLAHIEV